MAERGAISAALSLGEQNYQCNWNSIPGSGIITSDTDAEDLKCIALAIHEMVGRIPLTMRSRNHYGLRCEGGEVIDTKYTGPVLEEALKKGTMIRKMSPSGVYHGIPVVVAPIIRKKETVAVIGIVDITKGGIFDSQYTRPQEVSDLGLSGVAAYMYKPILHIEIAQWINDRFLPINGSFFPPINK